MCVFSLHTVILFPDEELPPAANIDISPDIVKFKSQEFDCSPYLSESALDSISPERTDFRPMQQIMLCCTSLRYKRVVVYQFAAGGDVRVSVSLTLHFHDVPFFDTIHGQQLIELIRLVNEPFQRSVLRVLVKHLL